MAKLLKVRGSTPAHLLMGRSGIQPPRGNRAKARDDANAAIENIPTASEYQKDIIWQYVFNESLAYRWQYISRLWVARLDDDATINSAALTCIKSGVVATRAGLLTSTHIPQVGWRLPVNNEVNLNTDPNALFGTGPEWTFGTFVSDISNVTDNFSVTAGQPSNGGTSLIYTGPTTFSQAQLKEAAFNPVVGFDYLTQGLSKVVQVSRGATGPSVLRAGGNEYAPASDGFPTTNPLTSMYQARWASGNQGDQDWGMTFISTDGLDFYPFAENTETMMEALESADYAFSHPTQDGDSLQIDIANPVQYRGWVTATTLIPGASRVDNSSGGKFLKAVASQCQGLTDANPTADSMIIGAGINDIGNEFSPPIEDIATIKSYADDIFAIFDATDHMKNLLIKQITPFKGRFDSQNQPIVQDTRWQPYIDELNAHFKTLCDARPNAHLVLAYEAIQSNNLPEFADYIEGIVRGTGGDPDYTTEGTVGDGNLTVEGVHFFQSGANIIGALANEIVRDVRSAYYKGGRT